LQEDGFDKVINLKIKYFFIRKKGKIMNGIKFFTYKIIFALVILISSDYFAQPLAENHNKFLGNCIRNSVPATFDTYWNQVTPENAGKWGSVEASRDNYNWGNLDLIYNYARSNGFPFRFHVLIWAKQQPGWIADLDSAEQIEEIEEWIRLAGERYPDADYVEVVNEAIEYPPYDYYPVYRDAMGGAGETGWDWVIWAFEKARQYFPDAKLLLNEYNILSNQKSITTFLEIVELLKERDLIDGIAEQAHYFAISYLSSATMRSNLDRMASAGLPIQITEFEINEADDATQLSRMQAIFPVLWEHPAVEGITFWGYIQGLIWQTDGYMIRTDGTERPALQWLREYLSSSVDVNEQGEIIPGEFQLRQNYPNPFNPVTTINYSINKASNVRLSIYNLLGQKMKTIVNSFQNAGEYSVVWDATDISSNLVSSGIYFYRLETEGQTLKKKMVLIR
jgi:endo-1,4-beta-xylanase